MAPISIGRNSIVSQGSHLCAGTHDIEDPDFQLEARPIDIGDDVWIAAEAFIGPGVTVGDRAVIGARAVLFKDAECGGVYAGNPARLVKQRKLQALRRSNG
jgi:putative colanic acid biosynthesis acetyltransferase WcaF